MPEAQLKKDHFRFNRGLNTESNEINFPDGFSTDEQNYELLIDGSRRRRKGCANESGGSTKATGQTIGTGHAYNTYKWRGVGGDPDKNFIVHQVGDFLFFTDDADTISTTYHTQTIDLSGFVVDGATASTTVEDSLCQFAHGRGVLLVTNKYLRPFYVEYNSTANVFNSFDITLNVRDFDGIDDGVGDQNNPGTLGDDHRYNLRNRGWIEADIATYFSGQSVYPAKAQVWFKGYRRQTNVSYSDLDGVQEFDDAKLAAERFGQSSAPQGGLFLNPLDTRFSSSVTNEGDEVQISTWTMTGTPLSGGVVSVTTATAHGRSNGEFVTISGNRFQTSFGGVGSEWGDLNGFWEISNIGATTFDFTLPAGRGQITFEDQYASLGQINGNVSLPKSDGKQLSVGPTTVAYHAGRAWFAGIPDSEWADTVFFSKVAQKPAAFGVCHQEADPTNPEFNQLSSSDGGTIVIPNLGQVQRMVSMRDSIIVFSDQGVWEIGGGQRGVFTAAGYSVRQITEAECTSSRSIVVLGSNAVFTGPRGIHLIGPNQFTSVLEEQSISEDLVQTLWNAIPASRQARVQTVFDSALRRLYFLYGATGDNTNHYSNALVFDIRAGAYFKYAFNTSSTVGIVGAYSITESDSSDSNKKIKWTIQSTNGLITSDLDQTDYIDYDGAESPLPFVLTGWDNIGDFQARRQAPIVTVYAKRTETGYVQTGNGFDPVNESSNLLTAYWDWTGDAVSGKIGSQNETYRHVRGFVPSGTSDDDGYPVVVTRNKVRGRGRVLQLRFDGAATKDSHILGFTMNYKVSRGK